MSTQIILPPDDPAPAPPDRSAISPDTIAASLAAGIRSRFGTTYTVTLIGSTLKIVKTAGGNPADMDITVEDTLLGEGLTLIKGVVPDVTDLPRTCEDGYILRVQGDPESAADDAWFTFSNGRWDESAAPGVSVELDAQYMPWLLTSAGLGGARTFAFGPAVWAERKAGDNTNNPLPTLPSVDVLFGTEGRLGMTSGATIVLSQVGQPLNLFRRTITQLLPDDVVNVRSAASPEASFHAALQWDSALYLWSARAQVRLSGSPALSPTTISLDIESRFENDPSVPPIVLGSSVYFLRVINGTTRVFEYFRPPGYGAPPAVSEITAAVPTYLQGAPLLLVGDDALDFVGVLTTSRFYPCHFARGQAGKIPRWHSWTFPGFTTAGALCLTGLLYILGTRGGSGTLERLDVANPADLSAGVPKDASGTVAFTPSATVDEVLLRTDKGVETDGRFILRNLTLHHTQTRSGTLRAADEVTPRLSITGASPVTRNDRVPILRNAKGLQIELAWFGTITGLEVQGTFLARNRRL